MTEQLRLMAIHAHPDDESSKGAATMARYVAEGVSVLVVTCTGGERGSVLNPKLDRPEIWEDMSEIRRQEMAAARAILGVEQAWLGFTDSGLPQGDPPPPLPEGCFALEDVDVAAERLVRVIREFRPHVVTTYDESGGYPHPDHIMCHRVSVAAFDAAGDAERYPDAGAPWQPHKLYYHMMFSKAKVLALHTAVTETGLESPYERWLRNWEDRRDVSDRITTRVPCADYFPVRDDALRAHATQVDPDGAWFRVPLEIQRRSWPTEDYQLVRSVVGESSEEDDLFAGVRGAHHG